MFPRATGLKHIAESGAEVAVICRNNQYIMPQGGWFVRGTYLVTEVIEHDA